MIRTPLRRQTRLRAGGPVRKRRKTRKGQIPEAVLDALWAQAVRQRDKTCVVLQMAPLMFEEKPWCAGPIQAAHIYSRKYKNMRHDLDNGLGICARHHSLLHDNPVKAGRFYESVLGREKLSWMWAKAQAVAKVDRHAVKESLRARLREMEESR